MPGPEKHSTAIPAAARTAAAGMKLNREENAESTKKRAFLAKRRSHHGLARAAGNIKNHKFRHPGQAHDIDPAGNPGRHIGNLHAPG